tara:strand:- start:54781 stop:55035 length:255 start_codon:yes stop_codon:yes gene_type:complete
MKPGDLICYNAAGQKNKTLGLVLQIKEELSWAMASEKIILVQWCIIGDLMPRREQERNGPYIHDTPVSGEYAWHKLGAWFEVVK